MGGIPGKIGDKALEFVDKAARKGAGEETKLVDQAEKGTALKAGEKVETIGKSGKASTTTSLFEAKASAWAPTTADEKAINKALLDDMSSGGEETVNGVHALKLSPGPNGSQTFEAQTFARGEGYDRGNYTGTIDKTGKVTIGDSDWSTNAWTAFKSDGVAAAGKAEVKAAALPGLGSKDLKAAIFTKLSPNQQKMFGKVLEVNPGDKPNQASVHFYLNTKVEGTTKDYFGTYDQNAKTFKITERDPADAG